MLRCLLPLNQLFEIHLYDGLTVLNVCGEEREKKSRILSKNHKNKKKGDMSP